MPATEHDSALMSHAAIAVGKERGLDNLPAALSQPLPEGQRQYLYSVSDAHPLGKVYGASALSAILIDTQTPHLADRNPKGPAGGNGQKPARFGLRYCDRQAALDPRLDPFVSEEAKRAWRAEAEERRREQHAVVAAAQSVRGLPSVRAALETLPEPKDDPLSLPEKSASAISVGRATVPTRDTSPRNTSR